MTKGQRAQEFVFFQKIKPAVTASLKCVKSMFIFALQISNNSVLVKFAYLFKYKEKEN